jgi:hypothetical protein
MVLSGPYSGRTGIILILVPAVISAGGCTELLVLKKEEKKAGIISDLLNCLIRALKQTLIRDTDIQFHGFEVVWV